jgi:hypothetical protein
MSASKWATRAGLWERIKIAWKQFGEVTCVACGQTLDLEDVADEAELEELWNDHVDDAGGSRYV